MILRIRIAGLALVALFVAASCASDSYRAAPAGVAKVGKLRVTVDEGWRRATGGSAPEKHSAIRVYTKDGFESDRLYVIGGIKEGRTIFREDVVSGQPSFDATMSADQLAGLAAESLQAVLGATAKVTASNIEEHGFTGIPGVRFDLEASTAGVADHRGLGGAFIHEERLYAVLFVARAPDSYERHRETADAIISSTVVTTRTIGRH